MTDIIKRFEEDLQLHGMLKNIRETHQLSHYAVLNSSMKRHSKPNLRSLISCVLQKKIDYRLS